MDEHRFDDMARTLGERGSRRDTLRLLAGGILGALAGVPAAGALARRKYKTKRTCPKRRCPRGYHRNKRTCKCECTRRRCTGGREFNPRACRCACPRGMRECRDRCVARDSCCPSDPPCPEDPKGCCHAPGLDVCTIDGCCRELDGVRACNDFCVDTNTHPRHCGGCDIACGSGEACVAGQCEPAECPNGQPVCGDRCCGAGEECCSGVCLQQGSAVCTKDGWCPTTSGQACCGTAGCDDGPCCQFSAGEACCLSMTSSGALESTCCPGPDQCAPGGCCPVGTTWKPDGGCEACCPPGSVGCAGCVAPVPGRG